MTYPTFPKDIHQALIQIPRAETTKRMTWTRLSARAPSWLLWRCVMAGVVVESAMTGMPVLSLAGAMALWAQGPEFFKKLETLVDPWSRPQEEKVKRECLLLLQHIGYSVDPSLRPIMTALIQQCHTQSYCQDLYMHEILMGWMKEAGWVVPSLEYGMLHRSVASGEGLGEDAFSGVEVAPGLLQHQAIPQKEDPASVWVVGARN